MLFRSTACCCASLLPPELDRAGDAYQLASMKRSISAAVRRDVLISTSSLAAVRNESDDAALNGVVAACCCCHCAPEGVGCTAGVCENDGEACCATLAGGGVGACCDASAFCRCCRWLRDDCSRARFAERTRVRGVVIRLLRSRSRWLMLSVLPLLLASPAAAPKV